jgi:hypothetical protein
MSKKIEKHTIVAELAPTRHGSYQRTDERGRDVRGDASGEWALDADGEVEDLIWFASPSFPREMQGSSCGNHPASRPGGDVLPGLPPNAVVSWALSAEEPFRVPRPNEQRILVREQACPRCPPPVPVLPSRARAHARARPGTYPVAMVMVMGPGRGVRLTLI